MPRGPEPLPVTLTDDGRGKLSDRARRPTRARRLALRARIVLAAADGRAHAASAADLRVARPTVRKWRSRFATSRRDGLADEPRPGGPRSITDAHVEAAVTRTLEARPKDAAPWRTRPLARDLGLSQAAVARIWRASGLTPHLRESFQPSTGPFSVEKVRDVVGLYLAPPEKAVVVRVGEKSQVRAVDRTRPTRPPLPGRAEKATHDHARPGTTALSAAPDVATGQVIGACHRGHRHPEFVTFLDRPDADLVREPGTAIHVVVDNSGTHKHPRVREWFARHPEFVPHFAPTSSSRLNPVERSFAQITDRRIRRGSFRSVAELERAIDDHLRTRNRNPRPFVWTESADLILRKVQKLAERLAPEKPATNS